MRQPEQYKFFLERLGLSHIVSFDSDDELQRSNIAWRTLVFARSIGTELKPVETIESVLWGDRKVNTYKFALIRAICNLATHRHKIAQWHSNGSVSVDVDEIAMLWIKYYWPIVEMEGDGFIFQGQKSRDGSRSDISFRIPLQRLSASWAHHGGYSAFRAAYDAGRLPTDSKRLLKTVLSKLRAAIQQPVEFAGNEQTGKKIFHTRTGP